MFAQQLVVAFVGIGRQQRQNALLACKSHNLKFVTLVYSPTPSPVLFLLSTLAFKQMNQQHKTLLAVILDYG